MTDSEQNSQKHFLLQEAIDLLKQRRNDDAVPILAQYLKIHPNSEQGWFALSYAVREKTKKIYALEKVLDINPENEQARERLEKLSAPLPITEPQEEAKPKNYVGIVVGAGIIVFAIILVIGILGLRQLSNTRNVSTVTPQQLAQAPPSSTANLVPSPSPTQMTRTPSPTVEVYSTSTPTATIQPTAVQIDENALQQMDQIQVQVADLRQLPEKFPVQRNFIHENDVRPLLEKIYLEQYTRDAVDAQARILSALGLIDPKYDMFGKTLDQLGEGIGGFYIPWKDELYVIGTEITGIEKFIFAHEYSHALVDQYYDFDTLHVYPKCLSEADRCSAISALIEGDATYLMYQWLEKYGTETDIQEILTAQYAPLDKTISASDLAPPYVIREANFRYGDGLVFVDYLYQIGRWQMINKAYETLPATSEQILHPQKFQIRETAIPLEMPDLQPVLGNGWLFLGSGTLGELGTEMILGYSANGLSQIAPEAASEAAAGWGGDNYQVYYKSTTNKHVLAVYWIWDDSYAYDIDAEAEEFWIAMWEYMNLRYRGDIVETEIGDCWQLLNDHYSCIFRNEMETLWVSSPDLDLLEVIRDQYPAFGPQG